MLLFQVLMTWFSKKNVLLFFFLILLSRSYSKSFSLKLFFCSGPPKIKRSMKFRSQFNWASILITFQNYKWMHSSWKLCPPVRFYLDNDRLPMKSTNWYRFHDDISMRKAQNIMLKFFYAIEYIDNWLRLYIY